MILIAKYDQITGKRKHFTIGKPGSKISGGIYFGKGVPIPKELTIMFKFKESEKEELEDGE